jgi:hypothetical protein
VALGGVVVGYFSEDVVPGFRGACIAANHARRRLARAAARVVAQDHAHKVGLAQVDARLDSLIARYRTARHVAIAHRAQPASSAGGGIGLGRVSVVGRNGTREAV